jgi:hypothetical protein
MLKLFNREIMAGTDYRQKYVTCDDYKESDHSTSDVDLLTALTQVSAKLSVILTYVMALKIPLPISAKTNSYE